MRDTELKRERDKELYRTYLRGLKEEHFETVKEAADWCRQQPAPKFYLSSKSLVNYIAMIMCGSRLTSLHGSTRRKVVKLFHMYLEYREQHPEDRGLSRERVCEILVEEPAPEFYIDSEMAIKILLQERKKRWQE